MLRILASHRRASSIAFCAWLLCAFGRTGFAQPRVVVPEGCGSLEQFQAQLRERVGPESEPLLARTELAISPEPDGYRLLVQVGDQSRTLKDKDCADLFRAGVVVALALWNAPTPAPPASEAAALPAANRQQAPPARASRESAAEPPQPEPTRWRWQGSAGAQLGVVQGLLPRWALAVGAFGACEYGPFGLVGDLRYLPPSDERDENDKGVRVRAQGASLAARYRAAPWLGTEVGGFAYRVKGEGLGSRADRSAVVVAAGPQLGLWVTALELAEFELRLGSEAQFALWQPRFEVLAYKEVFHSSRVLWRGYLAAGYRF